MARLQVHEGKLFLQSPLLPAAFPMDIRDCPLGRNLGREKQPELTCHVWLGVWCWEGGLGPSPEDTTGQLRPGRLAAGWHTPLERFLLLQHSFPPPPLLVCLPTPNSSGRECGAHGFLGVKGPDAFLVRHCRVPSQHVCWGRGARLELPGSQGRSLPPAV